MKRLIVCCDGTWQKLSNVYPTNVVKIASGIKHQAKDNVSQIIFYDEGLGTGDKADRLLGGAFGRGIDRNIQDAYRFLCWNYEPEDEIYLYGYSRGAYTVRSLVGLIYCSGLLHRHKIDLAGKAYQIYRQRTKPGEVIIPDTEEAIAFRRENGDRVPITFLGCWDTVGALGIPDQFHWLPIDRWNNQKYQFHDTSLSPIVLNACHAVAIDEIRKALEVTPMVKSSRNLEQKLHEVWFPGNHGCVGGGTKEQSGLSDGALQWMIDESKALGLEIDESAVLEGINPDPTVEFDSTPGGAFFGRNLRTVNCFSLHSSVVERWTLVGDYRPKNLVMCQQNS